MSRGLKPRYRSPTHLDVFLRSRNYYHIPPRALSRAKLQMFNGSLPKETHTPNPEKPMPVKRIPYHLLLQ